MSPVETASMLLVNDQLTCQATLLNSCKTVDFQTLNGLLLESFKSDDQIITLPPLFNNIFKKFNKFNLKYKLYLRTTSYICFGMNYILRPAYISYPIIMAF